jgi:hypothetical protein
MEAIILKHPRTFVLEHVELPEFNFSHIRNLTDDTGIIQHAIFNIPNRKEGYCIDDNARALLLLVLACKDKQKHRELLPLLQVYLSFIHYMQTDNGEFKNFMSYIKVSEEERGSEDSFGRTIMALGYLVKEGHSDMFVRTGVQILLKAYAHIENLQSLRGIANSIVGICRYVQYNFPDDITTALITKLADKMVAGYEYHNSHNWHWFEPVLTYDNGILPLALLFAGDITGNKRYLAIGFETMDFLESQVFNGERLSPIGNEGWYVKGGTRAHFDQQGIDAMAMVLLYQQAYQITRENIYLRRMYNSYKWFLGQNDLGLSLYDPETGGCADGLHTGEINLNQGAESTLAYWISHLVVSATINA